MQNSTLLLLLTAPLLGAASLLGACGGSFPPPTERLAAAQAAERSAVEVGANDAAAAQLSLKLARDQIDLAQKAMANGENEQADSLLIRAKMDAELALAQAREKSSTVERKEAVEESAEQKATNVGQGAVK